MIKRWLHRITHILGWHHGIVTTWAEGGAVMVGFRCNECGQVEGAHPIHFIPKQKVDA